MNDNYKYGFGGKNYSTPNRPCSPRENNDYQEFYDIALDDLYNYVMICLQQNGDLYQVLEDYIVRDFGEIHIVLEDKDICKTVFEVVRDIDKKNELNAKRKMTTMVTLPAGTYVISGNDITIEKEIK